MTRSHDNNGVPLLGYFGSYARGDWGPGSDFDLVAVVQHSPDPFELRAVGWRVDELPVPADLVVFTLEEWQRMRHEERLFFRTVESEAVWVVGESDRRKGH